MNILLENKYLGKGTVSEGFSALHKSRSITFIATGLLGLFVPIFLYNLFGQSIRLVALFYLIGSLLYTLSLAWGAQYLNKFGFRKALQTAIIFSALSYFFFFLIDENNYKIYIPLIIISSLIYRLLYWVPYNVDFAKFTSKNNRGKEISIMGATKNAIAIFTPLLAGYIITKYSFNVLFVMAIILYLLSIIPLLKLPRTKEKFTWTIKETWKNFFSRKRRPEVLAFMADGGEGIIGGMIWPVFMLQILNGNYLELGILSSIIVGITIVLQLVIGNYTDNKKTKKENVLGYSSIFYALGWIIKIFIATAFQIFVIDAYHKLTKIFMRIPFEAITYEKAANEGHFVDEFTVIREMAIHTGRVIMLSAIIFISLYFNLQTTFILGAIAAILLNTLRMKKVEIKPKV
ncbi:MAG: MFS transporter [Candidatus Pacebacteria bacterium]|nr:MFS transporter [Candidatus Paceibacterota bacterium]